MNFVNKKGETISEKKLNTTISDVKNIILKISSKDKVECCKCSRFDFEETVFALLSGELGEKYRLHISKNSTENEIIKILNNNNKSILDISKYILSI